MNRDMFLAKIRRHRLASALFFGSALLSIWILWRSPKLVEEEERLVALEREWRQIQMNTERAVGLTAQTERLEQILAGVEERLLRAEDVALNYEMFLKNEQAGAVALDSFSQDPLPDKEWTSANGQTLESYTAIPFTLEVLGDYRELLLFLQRIDESEGLGRIGFVSIDTVKDADPRAPLRAKVVCHFLGEKDE